MGKKKQEPVDPNNLKPEDVLKFEIAAELGLADKVVAGGWRCLTAKESGRIGGPISYTHLDVYKRQVLLCLGPIPCLRLSGFVAWA